MKVEVRPLRVKGRTVPHKQWRETPPAVGLLEVKETRLPRLGRTATTARLLSALDPLQPDALPMLTDVQLLWVERDSMRLTGDEHVDDAGYVQTWDIKVLGC